MNQAGQEQLSGAEGVQRCASPSSHGQKQFSVSSSVILSLQSVQYIQEGQLAGAFQSLLPFAVMEKVKTQSLDL